MINGKLIGVKEGSNTFVLKKTFSLKNYNKVTLSASALGIYFASVNGIRVGDAFFAPGWTCYDKTLQVQEYDITRLLRAGENEIALTVNIGWYCGEMVWKDRFAQKQTAVIAQLTVDGEVFLSTDETWLAAQSYIRESSIYGGEVQDFSAKLASLTACEVQFDLSRLSAQRCEPVRNIERLPVKKIINTPNGERIFDFGQNISGVVEVCVPADFSGTFRMNFAEILVGGNFYTDNLRAAKATDVFTVQGAKIVSPEFTYHGFRYLKITGAEFPAECVTAMVRHTDIRKTASVQTSDSRFNRLINNVFWSERDNMFDVPTDCPQRDERLGWTGDINAFCTTAAFNYDVRGILTKWLADVRNEQAQTGELPHVVPDCYGDKHTNAMWGDCITMVPFALYKMYGDKKFLKDNFDAMKKFISAREGTMRDGLVVEGCEFGDWLALDHEQMQAHGRVGRTDIYYITNVFQCVSLKIVADSAKILGEKADFAKYSAKYREHLKRVRKEYFSANGRLVFDTITAQVLALHFNIVENKFRDKLAKALNDNVAGHGYRVVTGFVGTPYLLFALADNGYFETACRVMLNNAYPGWLYEVDMGATTIWEHWDSLLPDGTPNPDGMNSYNHYAYGSVLEFVYRKVAGIEPDKAGFSAVTVAPNPVCGLERVSVEFDSVSGKIKSAYEQKGEKIVYTIEIPAGVKAKIVLPCENPIFVSGGKYEYVRESKSLSREAYRLDSLVVEVVDNPRAKQAFDEVFGGIFSSGELITFCSELKTLGDLQADLANKNTLCAQDFEVKLKEANAIFARLTKID